MRLRNTLVCINKGTTYLRASGGAAGVGGLGANPGDTSVIGDTLDREPGSTSGRVSGLSLVLMRCLLAVAVALVVPLLGVSSDTALASASIRISPSKIEKAIRSTLFIRDTGFGPIRVTNNGDVPVRVRVYAEDLLQAEDGSAVFSPHTTYTYGISDIVELDPQELIVEPGRTGTVKGRVVEYKGRNGGGYCVVFFEAAPVGASAAEMSAASRVGALVYITFPGQSVIDGSISDLSASEGGGVATIRFMLNNTGNIHVRPWGVVRVKTTRGSSIAEKEIPAKTVLPGSSRWFDCEVDLPSGVEGGPHLVEVIMALSGAKSVSAEARSCITTSGQ